MTLIKIIARFIRHLYRSCGFLLTSVTMMANQPQFRHKYGKKLTMFSWDAKWFWVRPITFLLSLVLPYSCFSYKVIKLYSHRLTLYRNNPITDYINLKLIFSLFKTHLLITENQTQFQNRKSQSSKRKTETANNFITISRWISGPKIQNRRQSPQRPLKGNLPVLNYP